MRPPPGYAGRAPAMLSNRIRLVRGLAALVIVFGGWCVVQAVRQSAAQALYHQARYRAHPAARRQALVERAFRLDPTQHWLCRWWAANRYRVARQAPATQRGTLLRVAGDWADRGLALNPYSRPLRLVRVRVLAADALPRAIREWRAYVDWHYWHPANHAVLADLYLRAGNWPAARQALTQAVGAPDYAALQKRLRLAIARDRGR